MDAQEETENILMEEKEELTLKVTELQEALDNHKNESSSFDNEMAVKK